MCSYTRENKCAITTEVCPYVYYCDKIQAFKPSPSMPKDCKIKRVAEIPKGYCRVRGERKGWLYIDVKEETIKVKNPFDCVPLYVKVVKTKTGIKLYKQ